MGLQLARATALALAFTLAMSLAPSVKAQETFGNTEAPTINWSTFWQLFNAHSDWNLEYNTGSGWFSIKSDLQIIRNYQILNRTASGDYWVETGQSDASRCKVTLNFTASYSASYRLTFGIDLDVKNYTYKSGAWNYTISYQNYVVYFDWTDIMSIPGLIVTHGVMPVGDEQYFWFRIRRDNVPQGVNVVIDPTFGKTSIGGSTVNAVQDVCTLTWFSLPVAGTVTQISCYSKAGSNGAGNRVIRWGLYDSSGNLLASTSATEYMTTTPQWWNGTISYAASAGTYGLAFQTDVRDNTYYYDAGTSQQTWWHTLDGALPNPHTGANGKYDEARSIFATYTATGGQDLAFKLYATAKTYASATALRALRFQLSAVTRSYASLDARRALGFQLTATARAIASVTATFELFVQNLFFTLTETANAVASSQAAKELSRLLTATGNAYASLAVAFEGVAFEVSFVLAETVKSYAAMISDIVSPLSIDTVFAVAALALILGLVALGLVFVRGRD